MVTKNFRIAEKFLLMTFSSPYYGILGKDINGTNVYLKPATSTYPFISNLTKNILLSGNPSTSGNIFIGSGTTQPTENDYTLENRITSGITVINTSERNSENMDENGNLQATTLYTIKNTTNSSITISEIGLFVQMRGYTTNGTSSNSYYNVMLDRTVLDTPLVLGAGETGTLQYTIKVLENE